MLSMLKFWSHCTWIFLFLLSAFASASYAAHEVRGELHFPLYARGTNKNGSLPAYRDYDAPIEDRVNDLLPRMTLEEKVSQL